MAQAICDLSTSQAGYSQAFVGYAEHDERLSFRVIAGSGFGDIPAPAISWNPNDPTGQGAIGECIRIRQPIATCRTSSRYMSPLWIEMSEKLGYQSSIAIPIIVDDRVLGVMAFFSKSPGPADETEIFYLQRLVADLAYAIRTIRLQENVKLARRSLATEAEKREQLEQKLAESRHMESLGQLAGGVAHDFNNKLQIIKSNLEMLQSRLTEKSRELERVNVAMRATDNASELVNGLLAFARRQPLVAKIIDVPTALKNINQMVRATVPARIKLVIESCSDLWPVSVDSVGFESAITNLIKNATDAIGPNRGTIRISAKNVIAASKPNTSSDAIRGDFTCIEVEDNGCGIPADILPKVFEPFFTTKAPGKGTGLGLASVYGFAKQSGGTLKIESVERKGTILSLFLPRATSPVAPENFEDPASLPPLPHCSILLVEDEPELRDGTASFLREIGMDVFESDCTLDAIKTLMTNSKIDIVFTDVRLRGSDSGLNLMRKVQSYYQGVRMIVTSGNIDITELGAIAALQNVTYLPKPYSRQMIIDCLRQILTPPEPLMDLPRQDQRGE